MNGSLWHHLITADTTIKVSSTLDKSVSKKHLVDGSAETCWTSGEGIPQIVQLTFPKAISPKQLSLTFQGGFVGTRCAIHVAEKKETQPPRPDWVLLTTVYPEDVNRRQLFLLPEVTIESGISSIKFTFEESSDFFGRVTIYNLQLEGVEVG